MTRTAVKKKKLVAQTTPTATGGSVTSNSKGQTIERDSRGIETKSIKAKAPTGDSAPLPNQQKIRVSTDSGGKAVYYHTINPDGSMTTYNPYEWNNANRLGGSNVKPRMEILGYQQKAAYADYLNSPQYQTKVDKKLMEEERLKQLLPPEPSKFKEYEGQPMTADLPEVTPDEMPSSVLKSVFSKGGQYALAAGAGASIPAAATAAPSAGLSLLAIPAAAAGGFVTGAVKGGFTAAKNDKAKVLTQAGSLGSDAETGIKETINFAGKGMPEGEVRKRFEEDKRYLAQAQSNLKALDAKDPTYFDLNGLDEMREVERAIANLPMYAAQLEFALANQDPNRADMYVIPSAPSGTND